MTSQYFDAAEKQCFSSPSLVEHGQHMVMKNVVPEMKKKYVNIDTRFREAYTAEQLSNIQYELPQTISNVLSMKVTHMEIPMTFFNFSSYRGNTLFHMVNKTTLVVTPIEIDDGTYTLASIVQEINDKMAQENIPNIGLTVDPVTHKVMFSNYNTDSSGNYEILFDVESTDHCEKTKKPLKTKLGWALGFRETNYELLHQDDILSEGIVNLYPYRYFYLAINEFAQNTPNSFLTPSYKWYMNPNVIARISFDPNANAFGSIMSIHEEGGHLKSDLRTYSGKTDIKRFHIQLLDENCQVVDLNQMDFSFLLEITFH
jgi:hypothetical protein